MRDSVIGDKGSCPDWVSKEDLEVALDKSIKNFPHDGCVSIWQVELEKLKAQELSGSGKIVT